jgi:hypothetical protein
VNREFIIMLHFALINKRRWANGIIPIKDDDCWM